LSLVLFSLFLLAVGVFSQNDDCQGFVGGWRYSLEGLVRATGGRNQTASDPFNTYYYRPCNVIDNPLCGTNPSDNKPAGCQRDSRKVPQYHDLGSASRVTWARRNGQGADKGFVLGFAGGSEDRSFDIEFICNPTIGVGAFETQSIVEQPQHVYHLKWETAFACPWNSSPCY